MESVLPEGPRGEKHPAEMTGEEREQLRSAAMELGRRGGKARAAKMSPRRRQELARYAAESRWRKTRRSAP